MGNHLYKEEEHDFLKKYVWGHSYKETQNAFIERFGWQITERQVKNYIKNNHLRTGIDTRFKKGNVPPNYTSFKKGHSTHTYKPIGSEAVNSGGYIKVKVADPSKWCLKHNMVWEKHNGTIPKGSIVIFLDGNKSNFDIDNLHCITKKEHLYLNRHGMRFSDPELMKTAINIAKVECKIAEKKVNRTLK